MEIEKSPLVYIIVLNFNGKQHLDYCLKSIMNTSYDNFKVLFVDNDSHDGSMEYVKENFPEVLTLQTGANLGWAGGNNRGIHYASEHEAKYVVLANNDIKVHPMWVQGAIDAFKSDNEIAFVGGDVYGDTSAVPVEEFEEACKNWQKIDFSLTEKSICGMALFADINKLIKLGMIDEGYFAYGEESDLQVRGRKARFKSAFTNVPIWHYSSGTFSQYRLKASYLAIRNNMRLAIKHFPFIKMLKTILNIFYIGCMPFYKGDMNNVTISRMRPRNIFINFLLISYCLVWNIINLPKTFKRSSLEKKLIKDIIAKRDQN